MHKILRDYKIQTDNLILARRADLVLIKKKRKICCLVDFAVLKDDRVKIKERETRDKYL